MERAEVASGGVSARPLETGCGDPGPPAPVLGLFPISRGVGGGPCEATVINALS